MLISRCYHYLQHHVARIFHILCTLCMSCQNVLALIFSVMDLDIWATMIQYTTYYTTQFVLFSADLNLHTITHQSHLDFNRFSTFLIILHAEY